MPKNYTYAAEILVIDLEFTDDEAMDPGDQAMEHLCELLPSEIVDKAMISISDVKEKPTK